MRWCIGTQKLIYHFHYHLCTGQMNRGSNSPWIFSRKSWTGQSPVRWWDDIRAPYEGGAGSPSLLETPLVGTAKGSSSLSPWIRCTWPPQALGRRDPGSWAPQWPPLLMTSSLEIWSSSFWRRKWEPPAEPSSWSWLEGKDSGLKMSSGKRHHGFQFVNKQGFFGTHVFLHLQKRWLSHWENRYEIKQQTWGN